MHAHCAGIYPPYAPSISHARGAVQVESVFASTGTQVNLLAISEGPLVTLGFLHRMLPAWKAKYINWFIANSPVWSGSITCAVFLYWRPCPMF
jgi:hypothetical protein